MFTIGEMVFFFTKNLTLPGIHKFQPQFMGPFLVISTGCGSDRLDITLSMDYVHPQFHTRLLKPVGHHSAGLSALEDDSYEVEIILQINKYVIYTKEKLIGYDSSKNQQIKLSKVRKTAPEVVKTFLRGEGVSDNQLRMR